MIKISIVVPVYNVEKYLAGCLDSVLEQTFSDGECIVVNDGSLDSSLKIARSYEKKDGRFRVLTQENQGLSAARNAGIQESCGEYITLLDSDDSWHKDFLRVLYAAAHGQKCQIAVCGYTKFEEEVPELPALEECRIIDAEEAVRDVLARRKRFMITAWGKLYERSLFSDIRYPAGMLHEDEFVTYRLYAKCSRIAVTECGMYYYFQRTGSIMSKYRKERLCVLKAFKDSISFVREKMPGLSGEVYVNYLFNLAIAYYQIRKMKDCKEIRRQIRDEYHLYYKEFQWNMTDNFVKKAALVVFRYAKGLYCAAAGAYVRMDIDE